MNDKPRVLLVGAGAVGQVFGHVLRQAGCELSFFVKEKYVQEARRGFTLHALDGRGRVAPPTLLSGFDLYTSAPELARRRWDQVWLCTSSPALRQGDWVEQLARHTGDATWVMLQPSPDDRAWLLRWIPAERLVTGMIPFLSFHSPLRPGDASPPPGTAWWMPPLAQTPFSGPPERREAVVRTLRSGGYRARSAEDVSRTAALPTALLTVAIAGLEAAGWRFERFLQPDSLERVLAAAREAVHIVARHWEPSATRLLPLLRPTLVRLLVPVARRASPVDLETYLRVHFTKVADQGDAMMHTYITMGRDAGQEVGHLEALLAQCTAGRGPSVGASRRV